MQHIFIHGNLLLLFIFWQWSFNKKCFWDLFMGFFHFTSFRGRNAWKNFFDFLYFDVNWPPEKMQFRTILFPYKKGVTKKKIKNSSNRLNDLPVFLSITYDKLPWLEQNLLYLTQGNLFCSITWVSHCPLVSHPFFIKCNHNQLQWLIHFISNLCIDTTILSIKWFLVKLVTWPQHDTWQKPEIWQGISSIFIFLATKTTKWKIRKKKKNSNKLSTHPELWQRKSVLM